MESTINGYEYNLMAEFDFSKLINATILFDSDEDEINKETNTLPHEKHDNVQHKVTKYLDMPSLDEHNSTTKTNLGDLVTGLIQNYISKTKNTHDTKFPKRKNEATSNNTMKNKLDKTNNMKEERSQHNGSSSSSPNNYYQNHPVASFSAVPNGQQCTVIYDKKPPKRKSSTTSNNKIKKTNDKKEIKSHPNENASSSSNNIKNCPLATFYAERIGQLNNVSNDICESNKTHNKNPAKRKSSTTSNDAIKKPNGRKEIQSQHNEHGSSSSNNSKNCPLASISANKSGLSNNDIKSHNSSLRLQPMLSATIKPITESLENSDTSNYLSEDINYKQNISTSRTIDNSQPVATSEDQKIEPTISTNIVPEEIGNLLNCSTSNSLPTNAHNKQPIYACIELEAELIKDSNPKINVPYEVINQQHTLTTSDLPKNTDNSDTISASIEQSVEHPLTFTKDVSEEIRNGFDSEIGDQLSTSISIVPPNTDSSCTFINVSEEIRNPLNTSSSSSSTNTNSILVSTNATPSIQTQQNNNNPMTYAQWKPLLDTVSEHLILIWNRYNGVLKDNSLQNVDSNLELQKIFYNYKMKLFDLSYSTVVNIILPRAYDRTFVKDFVTNTIALTKCNSRQTAKEISLLYLEMINFAQKMKQRIASESDFEGQILRPSLPPTATNTSLSELVNKPTNPHSCYSHAYSTRPPETQRPPPGATKSNTIHRNYPPAPYTNNTPPEYINTMPPQTYTKSNTKHRNDPPAPYTNNTPPEYINTMPPQTYTKSNTIHRNDPPAPYTNNTPPEYINTMPPQTYTYTMPPQTYINNGTPEQTKVTRSTHNENQPRSTKLVQNSTTRLNQRQQVNEVARRDINPLERQVSKNHKANVSSNYAGGTYHQPTGCTALPTPNHTQTGYCITNCIPANNSPYPKPTAESEYQKFLRAFKSQSLPNNSIHSQNHNYRANDPTQGHNNNPNNAYRNQANNIQQESDRSSISRDSGFYSPRDFEQETSTSPLITHVTSLNPDAVNIIKGSCFVCGKNTNQKCIGCYATYYCSYGCQNFDWRNHMAYCSITSNQKLRTLLSS